MNELSAYPITQKWPPRHPDRIQLYSLPTPNGVKVSIMLEETGLPYEPHLVSFDSNDQKSPAFLSLNPNGKIPAILDPHGLAEAKRLLAVLDRRLVERTWIMGDDYGIADISTFPWISNLIGFYDAGELVGIAQFTHVLRALNSFKQRPAVIRGSDIPKRRAEPS